MPLKRSHCDLGIFSVDVLEGSLDEASAVVDREHSIAKERVHANEEWKLDVFEASDGMVAHIAAGEVDHRRVHRNRRRARVRLIELQVELRAFLALDEDEVSRSVLDGR